MAGITISTTTDGDPGSLREALADVSPSFSIIEIDDSLAGETLSVISPLPDITLAITLSTDVDVTIAADLGGPDGAIDKDGTGTLTLSGSNSFGATTVSAGVLRVASDGNLGADTVTVSSGATLEVTGATTIDNALTGLGTLTKSNAGTLTLMGANSGSTLAVNVTGGAVAASTASELGDGAITLDGGGLNLSSGSFINDITVQDTATLDGGTGNVTLSGDFSGAGALTKAGTGTTTLSGASGDYDGAITVSDGVLIAGSDEALGSAVGGTTVSSGATLRIASGVEVTDALSVSGVGLNSNGAIQLQSGAATASGVVTLTAAATVSVGSGATLTFSDTVAGGFALTKTGTGTLTLSGTSTYSGATTVSAGSLVVTGVIVSDTTVASGATLSGTGTIDGDVTVNGTLAPGASPGILHTGNLTISSGGALGAEIGGATVGQYDQVQVTGTVTLSGALNASLVNAFNPTSGTFVLIDNDVADAVVGTFTGLAEGATVAIGGTNFTISYVGGDGNDVALTYAAPPPPTQPDPEPEPNTPTLGNDVLTLPVSGGMVSGGFGQDTVTGEAGGDWINGNVGDDRVFGGGGSDTLLGGQGADYLQGNTGDDIVFGDLGDDTVMGGQGQDVIDGGDGVDVLLGDLGDDRLLGGASQDTLQGGAGNDFLQGNTGDDLLFASEGADSLLGGQGGDTLSGGDGNDVLSGDLGDDVLTGGAGADVFNFAGGAGREVIADFSHAQGDHILLSSTDAADFAAVLSKAAMVGADTVITLDTEVIVLSGVSIGSLTASDFLFA